MNLLLHKAPQISDSALELPSQFFTREGVKVEITGDRWTFPLLYRHSRLDFSRVENDTLKTSIKRCISKRKLTAVCSHQTRIGNLDAHLI